MKSSGGISTVARALGRRNFKQTCTLANKCTRNDATSCITSIDHTRWLSMCPRIICASRIQSYSSFRNEFAMQNMRLSSTLANTIYAHDDELEENYEKHTMHHNPCTHSSHTVEQIKHCDTCTCEDDNYEHHYHEDEPLIHDADSIKRMQSQHVCQDDYMKNDLLLPPPLPEPKYSFHRRVMPEDLIQFSSPEGKMLFRKALLDGYAEAFYPLSEQFLNQADPAYCGVTTLIMVLNAFGIDPNIRWKGGWRWFGSEEMILDNCCINPERVRRAGILLEEFQSLARCQGLVVDMKRPLPLSENFENINDESEEHHDLDEFRDDIIHSVQNPPTYVQMTDTDDKGGFMVVSFSRASLGQTGDGHFSPIAAYCPETDRCLVLDVARFKYPPYWVSVRDLYESARPIDSMTNKSRGWFMISPPENYYCPIENKLKAGYNGTKAIDERKRPAKKVPLMGEETNEQRRAITTKAQNCAAKR